MKNDLWFMKKPCVMCPFRKDVDFRFSEDRATEFAYLAQNPFNSFPCHKTADTIEDDETECSEFVHGSKSKECAGFLTLQICEGRNIPKGFTPSYENVYEDVYEMIERYSHQ